MSYSLGQAADPCPGAYQLTAGGGTECVSECPAGTERFIDLDTDVGYCRPPDQPPEGFPAPSRAGVSAVPLWALGVGAVAVGGLVLWAVRS